MTPPQKVEDQEKKQGRRWGKWGRGERKETGNCLQGNDSVSVAHPGLLVHGEGKHKLERQKTKKGEYE